MKRFLIADATRMLREEALGVSGAWEDDGEQSIHRLFSDVISALLAAVGQGDGL